MINFVIVHYNTPELTTCLCCSILKQHNDAKIFIFDNSDKRSFMNSELFGATYFDNTKGQIIDFDAKLKEYPNRHQKGNHGGNDFGSAKHTMSIDWLCTNLPENFILLDSDVLLKRPIDFINDDYVCISELIPSYNIIRIAPFISYINVKKMKECNIKFFDGKRMMGLYPDKIAYDTGASFYEDIKKLNLHSKIDADKYIVHYGNGSWRSNKFAPIGLDVKNRRYEFIPFQAWLLKYKSLWK